MKKIDNLEIIIEKKIKISNLEIFSQPIIDFKKINSSNLHDKHFEILSRFYNSNQKLIPPDKIFSIDRNSHFFEKLDYIIFEEVFKKLHNLSNKLGHNYLAAINVSKPTIFRNGNFLKYIEDLRKTYSSIKPENIQFELTEKGDNGICDFLNKSLNLGYNISIDDFGTENFSVQKLRNVVLNQIQNKENFSKLKIKVDRAFIKNLHNKNTKDLAIDHAFLEIALAIKKVYPQITLVAEGIEEVSTAKYLRKIGFDYGQGFLWGKPQIFNENYEQPKFEDFLIK